MSSNLEKGIKYIKDIADLNSNVKALQSQMERAITQIEVSREEIRSLKSELRVLEKDIHIKSMETVINAHSQIFEKLHRLELQVERSAASLDGKPASASRALDDSAS